MLHQAQHDLRVETVGPLTVALSHKSVFQYFDELRRIVEMAKQDILFIDPYLEAEFVSRYLPCVAPGVTYTATGPPNSSATTAVDLFALQNGATVQIRSAPNFHDRYVFIDRAECYQSGASFKDGAKSAATILTQITDAFPAMLKTYERHLEYGSSPSMKSRARLTFA